MAVPNVEDLSIEILNKMQNNIIYSRQDIVNEQRRILLISKAEESKFQFVIGFAINRLCNLGMIKRINRGEYIITDLGIEQLRRDIEELRKRLVKYTRNVKKNRIIAYEIFKNSNEKFLKEEKENIKRNVSEENICQNLANYLRDTMKEMKIEGYYADTEFDRNADMIKAIIDDQMKIIKIKCDLIVHSRGENKQQDNLIAIEMKKSTNRKKRKEDRERLQYMTRNSYYNEITYEELPRYICRYTIGIFYDINIKKQQVNLEYYEDGKLCKKEILEY